MAIFTLKYIKESSHKSKYDKYLKDDDDDENIEDEKEEKDATHLSESELRRIVTIIISKMSDYPKLKKCCDYIDLRYKDHINDDGNRESPLEEYNSKKGNSFIQLIDGDVFSGYPDFKDGGNTGYEKDEQNFVKDINKIIKEKNIEAKFSVGSNKDDEAIRFGVKSLKR